MLSRLAPRSRTFFSTRHVAAAAGSDVGVSSSIKATIPSPAITQHQFQAAQGVVEDVNSQNKKLMDSLHSVMGVGGDVAVEKTTLDMVPPSTPDTKLSASRSRQITPPTLREQKLGFVGWGAMAQAVSLGLLRQDLVERSFVMASDVVPQIMDAAKSENILTTTSNQSLVEWSNIIVIAVKPQCVDDVLKDIRPSWSKDKILVSICAGVTIEQFQKGLGQDAKVVRVMPNTPCLVAEAATAYSASEQCAEWECGLVHNMFSAVGKATHRVPEHLLNTVTGVSGSGPAYIYMLIQALSDAGVNGGLPRNIATSLAAQTVAGAARMVQETGQHPAILKENVTSPAGTTIAGVRALELKGFNSTIIEAVEAARNRAAELSLKA